jgi:CRP-like cAMP-binding protein
VLNRILLSIPDAEYAALRPRLELISLPHHRTLHEPNRKLEFAFFPNTGMISQVVTTRSGRSVEVGVVGNEGFTPVATLAGLRRSPHLTVVQIAGEGFRLSTSVLASFLQSCPKFQASLHRYAIVQGMQVAQTGGCNRLHDLEQRLARWLLITQDRVDSGVLHITHDFLATMLGTDRSSVTLAARGLQHKRIIEYTYGGVKILNRKKLENAACECYGIIQQFNGEVGLRSSASRRVPGD